MIWYFYKKTLIIFYTIIFLLFSFQNFFLVALPLENITRIIERKGTDLNIDGFLTITRGIKAQSLCTTTSVFIGSNLTCSGSTTLKSNLGVTGLTTLGSDLTVAGISTLGTSISFTGTLKQKSAASNYQRIFGQGILSTNLTTTAKTVMTITFTSTTEIGYLKLFFLGKTNNNDLVEYIGYYFITPISGKSTLIGSGLEYTFVPITGSYPKINSSFGTSSNSVLIKLNLTSGNYSSISNGYIFYELIGNNISSTTIT